MNQGWLLLQQDNERTLGDYYLNRTVRELWTITTSTGTLIESWGDYCLNRNAERILDVFYWDKNQGDLRVDLTEPEKAFDWISIRKILGSI